MNRLCLIYNFAQKYREAIFLAIDREWDCLWYFGRNTTDIKGMNIDILKRVHLVDNKRIAKSYFYQKGVFKLISNPEISTYFLLGDPHCISNWAIAAYIKLFKRNQRVYFWTHGWYGKESRATKIIKKLFYNLADGIFLYGNYAKSLMIKEGFNEDKLYVIHNSLDHSKQIEIRKRLSESDVYRSHFSNDNPNLIFIGRLTRVKKIHQLLEVLEILKKQDFDLNLTLVGDGESANELKNMANERGLSDNVWFYGSCYDDERNGELIFNADLCVAPGNVGLTAMHTMVFGTPVISHSDFKWQMPEFEAIVPGETGQFFKRDDVEDLALQIKSWLQTHPDRNKVRQDCYHEIDTNWTPEFQMNVLRENLKV